MLSELALTHPSIGIASQLKGSEDVKKGLFQDEDPLLTEKATLPTGVFAVHIFGAQNLYLDANFPPEHYGIYVQITVGSTTKCTSLKSPFKKGRIVWDEIKNFPVTISPKVTNPVNKVIVAVQGYDKLQPIPKYRLLGKTEFHLHKLAKKQWSMETFELQNRRKQYSGDLQLELAFAYGSYGYGLCDQLESHHPPKYYLQQSAFPHMELVTSSAGNSSGIAFAPKRVSHPNIIAFKEKITDLEPEISPYYSKMNFVPIDTKSRRRLQPKLTRLSQLHSEYSQLTSRSKRIHYLKWLLQEKDVHRSMPADQESESEEGSSIEDLGGITQFGLTRALVQMANLTFMAGAPELIQDADDKISQQILNSACTIRSTMDVVQSKGSAMETPAFRGQLQHVKPVFNSSDGGETSGESLQVPHTSIDIEADYENDESDDELENLAVATLRGRRSAVCAPSPSQKRR